MGTTLAGHDIGCEALHPRRPRTSLPACAGSLVARAVNARLRRCARSSGPRARAQISCVNDRPGHGVLPAQHRRVAGPSGVGARTAGSVRPNLPSLPTAVGGRASAIVASAPPAARGELSGAEEMPGIPAGYAPSNRSEAVQLAKALDERLREPSASSYEGKLEVYDAALDELVRQVSVHCVERGEVLARLRSFYSTHAAAFGSVTRKRQEDAGLSDLDVRLDSQAAVHKKLLGRVAKLEAKMRRIEILLKDGDVGAAKALILATEGDQGAVVDGNRAINAVSERLLANPVGLRVEILSSMLKPFTPKERAETVGHLLAALPGEEHVNGLHEAVLQLYPLSRQRAVLALAQPMAPSELLELVYSLSTNFQTPELVELLQLPLRALPKERTLDVMEMMLQLSPAVAHSVVRIYGRMAETQRLQAVRQMATNFSAGEVWQLKSVLHLEPATTVQKLEAELKKEQHKAAELAQEVFELRRKLDRGAGKTTSARMSGAKAALAVGAISNHSSARRSLRASVSGSAHQLPGSPGSSARHAEGAGSASGGDSPPAAALVDVDRGPGGGAPGGRSSTRLSTVLGGMAAT